MKDGLVICTNETIQITGEWPAEWKFTRLYDLGSFGACLYGELKIARREEEAEAFRASLHAAVPGTEAITMFHRAFSRCREKSGQWLGAKISRDLDHAIAKCADALNR
jgi:hypothetical protein